MSFLFYILFKTLPKHMRYFVMNPNLVNSDAQFWEVFLHFGCRVWMWVLVHNNSLLLPSNTNKEPSAPQPPAHRWLPWQTLISFTMKASGSQILSNQGISMLLKHCLVKPLEVTCTGQVRVMKIKWLGPANNGPVNLILSFNHQCDINSSH